MILSDFKNSYFSDKLFSDKHGKEYSEFKSNSSGVP